ncbi:DUF2784 family protein [Patescibacteria group bacterium]
MYLIIANILAFAHGIFSFTMVFGFPVVIILGKMKSIWGYAFFAMFIITPLSQVLFKGCPVTLLEQALRTKHNPKESYKGTFITKYISRHFGVNVKSEAVTIFMVVVAFGIAVYYFLEGFFGVG